MQCSAVLQVLCLMTSLINFPRPPSMFKHQLRMPSLLAGLCYFLIVTFVHASPSQHRRHRHQPRHQQENQARDLQVNLEWNYNGFHIFDLTILSQIDLPDACKAALQQPIRCHSTVHSWKSPSYHTSLFNRQLTDYVCDSTCGRSLQDYYNRVLDACTGHEIHGAIPTLYAGWLWAGFNETCLLSEDGNDYCNDVIAAFDHSHDYKKMSHEDLCSFCYTERMSMMQRTSFSIFDKRYQRRLQYIQEECGLSGSTDISSSPNPPQKPPKPEPFCLSDKTLTTTKPTTCDDIAEEHKLSSAALYMNNQPAIEDCSNVPSGTKLCLPPSCRETYVLQPEDTGRSIEERFFEKSRGIPFGTLLRTYNPWISADHSNLQKGSSIYGCVLCLGPPNGFHTKGAPLGNNPALSTSRLGHSWTFTSPPDDCEVAKGTTQQCGKWHKASEGDSCVQMAMANKITSKLLLAVNPSLGANARECDGNIVVNKAYCVQPRFGWDYPDVEDTQGTGNYSSSNTSFTTRS